MKKKNKKISLIIVLLFIIIGIAAAHAAIMRSENDKSQKIIAHFIDVGQADSTFIELPNGETMLIDAGNPANGPQVTEYIKSLNYAGIDYIVATHPHADHIGGMAFVISNLKTGKLYMPNVESTSRVFENLLDAIEENGLTVKNAKKGVTILKKRDLKIELLAPKEKPYSNINNASAAVKITYKNTGLLFTGDAEQAAEKSLPTSAIKADILKVGHHGAGTASSEEFINAVSPKIAVISCGKNNQYGHPSVQTLNILKNSKVKIYRTDNDGTVIVTADGNKKISVDKKKSKIKENAPPDENSDNKNDSDNQAGESDLDESSYDAVYVTKTGRKYHRSECTYLKSKIKTTVEKAVGDGFTPCNVCKPPQP